MFFDETGVIQLEQNPIGDPGRYGEGLAETGREFHLEYFNGDKKDLRNEVRKYYEACRTVEGFLRHPKSIWRENDISTDQLKPCYLAVSAWGLHDLRLDIEHYLERRNYRTGNGDFIHPSFYGAIRRANNRASGFTDFPLRAQAYLMTKVPYRWNDECFKQGKWPLEKAQSSSADYLNWFHGIIQCEYAGHTAQSMKAKESISPALIFNKVLSYYEKEPNRSWVIDLYFKAICKAYGITSIRAL